MMFKEKKQLFLLHFAGGSCYSFDFLKPYSNNEIQFIPLELPGRGKRFMEEALSSKFTMIKDYVDQIKKLRNEKPFVIFGHSMGATLALSVANEMQKNNDLPAALVVSGNAGPGIKDSKSELIIRHSMNDDEFKEMLSELGGVPKEVLENEELYKLFSPIMRADFEALEKQDYIEKDIKLSVPILALMGSDEESKEDITNWSKFTSNNFTSRIFPGGHFFIHKHSEKLMQLLSKVFLVSV